MIEKAKEEEEREEEEKRRAEADEKAAEENEEKCASDTGSVKGYASTGSADSSNASINSSQTAASALSSPKTSPLSSSSSSFFLGGTLRGEGSSGAQTLNTSYLQSLQAKLKQSTKAAMDKERMKASREEGGMREGEKGGGEEERGERYREGDLGTSGERERSGEKGIEELMRRKRGVFGVSGVYEEEVDNENEVNERALSLRKKKIVADGKGEAAVVRSVFAVNVQFLYGKMLTEEENTRKEEILRTVEEVERRKAEKEKEKEEQKASLAMLSKEKGKNDEGNDDYPLPPNFDRATAVLSRDALKESSARSTAVAEPKKTRVHSQLQTPLEKAQEMERKEKKKAAIEREKRKELSMDDETLL
ncbi:uncharacterized protein MONOS_16081 [Monocercomonoides exilis]|uniref:uncharacterized protein n=1 Tax=Monocercomonoides exilis TaxID=2049356 RepID=UPI00355996AE|nr:hypothetical protein MONOS_16081 [Monocercomonoides exilis]|eukprot:MONOS_16081.1-p1 / transcript=MONOS_16081.1 / gene=MONOS_16081 / organism=Monocercomonoides_exilis_PA203 / gene_product=unspecified product / transcript_product=unspecified product / location=Mono_scaffold01496:932-2183(-) / protein_length=363 / sequence_SO=supercontig / SO=protein_coding / is_pseudo=false